MFNLYRAVENRQLGILKCENITAVYTILLCD